MWAIVSTNELSSFEQGGRLVGILIAQQFDRDVLNWVFDAWEELHFLSGTNWHIAVPCSRAPVGNRRPERRDFDPQLSNQLRELYGIDRSDTPVLVLDNFADEDRQVYLKIGERERDRKAMFNEMAKFINRRRSESDYPTNNDTSRRRMIADLYNHMKLREAGGALLKLAPEAASAAARLLRGGL
jgi:hypothetical protein